MRAFASYQVLHADLVHKGHALRFSARAIQCHCGAGIARDVPALGDVSNHCVAEAIEVLGGQITACEEQWPFAEMLKTPLSEAAYCMTRTGHCQNNTDGPLPPNTVATARVPDIGPVP